jgi:hypothetical protein
MPEAFKIEKPDASAWSITAHKLDSYRWKQIRIDHGLFGAIVRFCRDMIIDFILGIRTQLVVKHKTLPSDPCDFLLLQASQKVIPLKRKKKLIFTLRHNGHSLIETAQETSRSALQKKLVVRPPQKTPLRYLFYAAYAEYIVNHYCPKVLLNDRNGSLLSPFLRLSLHSRGAILVHLAHATTVEDSRRLDMTDYDYYFLFGESSLKALSKRTIRFGSTQAVLSGSHMIDKSYNLPQSSERKKTILVLGVGPDKEKLSGYLETYDLLSEWIKIHPEYQVLFKPHPRSCAKYWKDLAENHCTVEVLSGSCSLAEALSHCSLVVNIMSNAVIEAALARRPIIYVNLEACLDIFDQEKFFGPKVETLSDLEKRIDFIQINYNEAVINSQSFAEYHLHHGVDGLDKTVEYLEALKIKKSIPAQSLKGTI